MQLHFILAWPPNVAKGLFIYLFVWGTRGSSLLNFRKEEFSLGNVSRFQLFSFERNDMFAKPV